MNDDIFRYYKIDECDENGVPLDWNECRTCRGSGEVVEVLTPRLDHRDPAFTTREWPCPTCNACGSLKAAALFELTQVPPYAALGNADIPVAATFALPIRCQGCGHPMNEGTWEGDLLAAPRRQGNLMDRESAGGGFIVLPDDAPIEQRQKAHRQAAWTWIKRGQEPADYAHIAVHYTACDRGCEHGGPVRLMVPDEYMREEWFTVTEGERRDWEHGYGDVRRIEASWRSVDVRMLDRPCMLEREFLTVLCFRCFAERTKL